MDLRLPRDARFVGVMREVAGCILEQLQAPGEAVDDVQLAVTEACANAVRHAVGTAEYSVRLEVSHDSCQVEIIDIGPGFIGPVEEGADPLAEADPEVESGRGLYLIRQLVDDFELLRDGPSNKVRLTKTWRGIGHLPDSSDGLPADLRP